MKKSLLILIIVIIFALIGTIGFFGYKYLNKKNAARSAVFMTNGQVYFGYLSGSNLNTLTLNDVYYLKLSDLQTNSSKQILLVKMGNELHGPQNTMYISRSQVLFWQMLRSDSKINDAIAKFNSGQSQ